MPTYGKNLLAGLVALAATVAWDIPAGHAASREPGLELVPCTIELVDGRQVEGRLAVQFELDDHLIVYAPDLATVRSFMIDHVHALTLNGKREQLNAKRPLNARDKALLGRVRWPSEPPDEGPKPPFSTESWPKPDRLLVWAAPGKSGRFRDPGNWLANGQAMTTFEPYEYKARRPPSFRLTRFKAIVGPDVDLLIPAAPSNYSVRLVKKDLGTARPRHITVEANAGLNFKLSGGYGNIWLAQSAEFYGGGQATIRGDRHSFIVSGRRMPEGQDVRKVTGANDPRGGSGYFRAKSFARKLVFRKDVKNASVELIGSASTGDETQFVRGVLIISDNSLLAIGPRCTQTVFPEAVLQLQSGAIVAKKSNYLARDDMLVAGTLRAGSPRRPITRHCYVGLSSTDWDGRIRQVAYDEGRTKPWWDGRDTADWPAYVSLRVAPQARIRTHSARPDDARLVFCWHGKEGFGDHIRGVKGQKQTAVYRDLLGQISLAFMGSTRLQDVTFRGVSPGGLMLANVNTLRRWRNVSFGDAQPRQLVSKLDLAEAQNILKDLIKASAYAADIE